jgi:hypothetical protein
MASWYWLVPLFVGGVVYVIWPEKTVKFLVILGESGHGLVICSYV